MTQEELTTSILNEESIVTVYINDVQCKQTEAASHWNVENTFRK
jgi:hypothetical protein